MSRESIEEIVPTTTAINPGAYNPPPKANIRRLLSGTLKYLRQKELSAAINYVFSQSLNYINQYRTKKVFKCNICNTTSPYFYHNSNKLRIKFNAICPNCDSRPRHRGLQYLYKDIIEEDRKILHFARKPVLAEYLQEITNEYFTTDYLLTDVDFPNENIQELTLDSSSFDYVLCNHVIEHVPEDEKALSEMRRILKRQGQAIITIPGDFRRENTIYFDDLKLNGHYRDYGLDFIEKAEKHFSKVEAIDLVKFDKQELSLAIPSAQDVAFVCQK